MNITDHPT
jgi:pimeloyl-ACP methyl ester carboxylesterase